MDRRRRVSLKRPIPNLQRRFGGSAQNGHHSRDQIGRSAMKDLLRSFTLKVAKVIPQGIFGYILAFDVTRER
jgi:hypothetical protein